MMGLYAYKLLARQIRHYSGTPSLRLCSTSSDAAVAKLADVLAGQAKDLAVERHSPLDLIPSSPARFYERENVGSWQTTLVIDGATPLLPTPIPHNVEVVSPDDIHWMTDIDVEGWDGVRNEALESRLLMSPALMGGTARSGREAVSYLSPNVMTATHRPLSSQAVRPKLIPLTFLAQVRAIFAEAGWKAEPSDKGLYLQRSAAIFGGTQKLVDALSDARRHYLTVFLPQQRDLGMWIPAEGRRCMTLHDFHQLTVAEDSDAVVLGLEEVGAMVRGLVLKCAECRATRFYRLADVGNEFRCSRCSTDQRLGERNWMVGAEPPWHYALAEVVFQFLDNNGDLPLLGAHDFIISREAKGRPGSLRRLEFTGELLLTDPDGLRSELDIIATDGSHLWVGEATTSARLEKTNAKETKRLQRLKRAADILGARGALLISSSEWNAGTVRRAESHFPGIWPRLEVRPGSRQASTSR